jgi:hypothetical protein
LAFYPRIVARVPEPWCVGRAGSVNSTFRLQRQNPSLLCAQHDNAIILIANYADKYMAQLYFH